EQRPATRSGPLRAAARAAPAPRLVRLRTAQDAAGARAVPHQRERAGRPAGGASPGARRHGPPPAPRRGPPGHPGQPRTPPRPRGRAHRAGDGGRDDHRSPPPEGPRQARPGKVAAAHARPPRGPGPAHQVASGGEMAGESARPHLSFWQIWNMAFGFLGIQFGWALQMANMSAIYEYLGADAPQTPICGPAPPPPGLLGQPIIGPMSDRPWNRLGRRRPYFLTGALLASFALIAMPHSSTLWMAAGHPGDPLGQAGGGQISTASSSAGCFSRTESWHRPWLWALGAARDRGVRAAPFVLGQ